MKYSLCSAAIFAFASSLNSPLASNQLSTPSDVPKFVQFPASSEIFEIENSSSLLNAIKSEEEQGAIAKTYLAKYLQIEEADILLTSSVTTSNGVANIHFAPTLNGLQVVNSVGNVNIDQNGNVLGVSTSWIPKEVEVKKKDSLTGEQFSATEALKIVANRLNISFDDSRLVQSASFAGTDAVDISGFSNFGAVEVTEKLYRTAENTLEKVYDLAIPLKDNFHNAFVSLSSKEVVGVNDWATHETNVEFKNEPVKRLAKRADFTYNVVGLPNQDFSEGRVIVKNPADIIASPNGWHDDGSGERGTTSGNNVQAQDTQGAARQLPENSSFNFDYPINENQAPVKNWQAGLVNTFYVTNAVHDIAYHYGFDEKSGNFQKDNFQKGGKGNDHVIANTQDGDDTNNANFLSPPDGRSGVMNMYLFTQTNPGRDGDLDNTIVIHELMHGISNRLTGGPNNANCLSNSESGGMGEGWSDALAFILTAKASHTRNDDRTVGAYAVKNRNGIRNYPFSTSLKSNPQTYSDSPEVHNIGEIWANILFEVYWNFVDKSGFSSEFIKDAKSGKGNTDFYQILMDGLKLQPCNPTFVSARDALLQADKARGSKYTCELWKGFSKRGLGPKANSYKNDFELPSVCQGVTTSVIETTTTTSKVATIMETSIEPTLEPTSIEPTIVEPTSETPENTETSVEPTIVEPTSETPENTETSVEPTTVEPTIVKPTLVETTLVEPTSEIPIVTETSVEATPVVTSVVPTTVSQSTPQPNVCAHSVCKRGLPLRKTCNSCVKAVCYYDSYCCRKAWDSRCIFNAKIICGANC
ncbi:hypothetical protein HK099_004076 [Clydaea vesicula]|uniref:Extracellular metalloproteinase n=1 Tax=Clydaea vesicula TaxID=447962 RepID=A0AAD5U741_9FUNG|nr:hypothetical protein HK099_004076 [Clydaea vesicula]